MIKYFAAIFMLTFISPVTAYSQSDGAESDKKMMKKLCRSLLKESVAQIDSGNYDNAAALLDSVFQCDAANPDAFYYKSLIMGWQGDTVGVMELLASGVEKIPLSSRLKILLARYLIIQRSYDKAWEQIDKVLMIKPREGEALFLKGIILQEQGDTTKALEIYQKALDSSLKKIK